MHAPGGIVEEELHVIHEAETRAVLGVQVRVGPAHDTGSPGLLDHPDQGFHGGRPHCLHGCAGEILVLQRLDAVRLVGSLG